MVAGAGLFRERSRAADPRSYRCVDRSWPLSSHSRDRRKRYGVARLQLRSMPVTGAPALLHIVGYVTGASLYAMLLARVVRTRGPSHRFTISTAILGLAWNVGELSAHVLDGFGLMVARDWMAAMSYAALGFLAAVAVASATRGERDETRSS